MAGLPWYGWAGIGAVGIAGYVYEEKKKKAAAAAAAQSTTSPQALTPITTIPYAANISYGNGSAGGARHGRTGATGPQGPAGPAGTTPAAVVTTPTGTTAPVVTPGISFTGGSVSNVPNPGQPPGWYAFNQYGGDAGPYPNQQAADAIFQT